MKSSSAVKPAFVTTIPLSLIIATLLSSNNVAAAPNNAPSFNPGPDQFSSACDGEVRLPEWAENVTDNDGGTSGLKFHLTDVSNPEIFTQQPNISWPSRTLSYRLAPGTEGGVVSEITAILTDTSGTGQGGRDTSDPQTFKIHSVGCIDYNLDGIEDPLDSDLDGQPDATDTDDDNDGISDFEEGSGILDSDGDNTPNSLDLDSDNDNIPDAEEREDSDNDGIGDSIEPFGDDLQTDSDGDGISDDLDLDDDNDGIPDTIEGTSLTDTDDDDIPDSLDLDSDNDGVSDLQESGFVLSLLTYDQNWVITSDVGANGIADVLETVIDSGTLQSLPLDSNNNGIADFQEPVSLLFFDDDSAAVPTIQTGISGTGCVLSGGMTKDPTLLLLALLALVGLCRRAKLKTQ